MKCTNGIQHAFTMGYATSRHMFPIIIFNSLTWISMPFIHNGISLMLLPHDPLLSDTLGIATNITISKNNEILVFAAVTRDHWFGNDKWHGDMRTTKYSTLFSHIILRNPINMRPAMCNTKMIRSIFYFIGNFAFYLDIVNVIHVISWWHEYQKFEDGFRTRSLRISEIT